MTRLSLTSLAAESAGLLRRFGPMAYLDFLAVGIFSTTLKVLLAPGEFRRDVSARGGSVLEILADPFVLLHEAVYALVFGAALLRVWWLTEGGAPDPALRRRLLAGQALPLVTLNLLAGYAAYLGVLLMLLPGFVVAALTTTVVPAVLVEQRGWNGLARSFQMTRRHILPLTAAWMVLILPWLLLTVWATPSTALAGADIGTLWLAWLLPDAFAAGLSTLSLFLVVAAYRQLVAAEAGDSGDRLDDIFR